MKASLYGHRNKKHGAQYSCPNCDFQSTRKDNLKKHQESVHKEAKYFCDQCNYQAAQKYSLKIHKEANMKESIILAICVTIRQQEMTI